MPRRREVIDFALWSSFARHAAMVDICSEKASEVDRIRPKNEHSRADRYFCDPGGVRRPYSEHSIADRYFCNPSGVRRPCSEHSIADRYLCDPSGVRRPCSEHSIADRYFCNPSGVPKRRRSPRGGFWGESSSGVAPESGRRGCPGEARGAKMSISWWVFDGFCTTRGPGCAKTTNCQRF